MFEHSYADFCKYGKACNKSLCSFQHKTENFHDQNAKLTEKEKQFELYVKTKFRKVLTIT